MWTALVVVVVEGRGRRSICTFFEQTEIFMYVCESDFTCTASMVYLYAHVCFYLHAASWSGAAVYVRLP